MRYWCLLLFGLLVAAGAQGQGFNKLYFDARPSMLFSSIEATDSSYYVTGVSSNKVPPLYRRSVIGKINVNGTVDTMIYQWDTIPFQYEIFGNSLKRIGNEYLACGEMWDSINRVFIIKFDTLMNVTFYKEYTDTLSSILNGLDVVQTRDGGYLMACNKSWNNDNNVLMLKVDSTGVLKNRKLYQGGDREYPWVIKPMLNGNYMIGAFRMSSTTYTPFWCKTWMIELDSMGNWVGQWQDSIEQNRYPKSMQQTADSGWIIVRQHLAYDIANQQKYNAGIVKYDKNFGKEWEVFMGDSGMNTGFNDVEILPDGKYIAVGTTPTWGHDSAYHWGWIVKFDVDGTIIWDKKYNAMKRYGVQSTPYDIDVMPNGDLLVCGKLQFIMNLGISPIQQGWIMRTDSEGCVLNSCVIVIDDIPPVFSNTEIQVYPNPANNMLQVSLGNGFTGGELKFYNTTGALVKQLSIESTDVVINVSALPKGLYFITAEKDGVYAKGKLVVE